MTRMHDDERFARRSEPAAENDRIVKSAIRWVNRFDRKRSADPLGFANWLLKSPLHVREFMRANALNRELRRFDSHHRIDVDELLRQGAAERNTQRMTPVARTAWIATRIGITAIAASMLIVIAMYVSVTGTQPPETFATAVGERRAIGLSDGSTIHLNTNTRVDVSYTNSVRRIRVVNGETFFAVAPDAKNRPFIVEADSTSIRDIGTEFRVYRRITHANAPETTVSVLKGKVHVSSMASSDTDHAELGAGEEAIIRNVGGDVSLTKRTLSLEDLNRQLAWRSGRLQFNGESLASAVQQFNRYNERPLVVADTRLTRLTVAGNFRATDPESFAEALRKLYGVEVTYIRSQRSEANAIVLSRRDAAAEL